ncbi:hypothetical protein ACA910_016320 [Epithemia clementina (nom. ined.)]
MTTPTTTPIQLEQLRFREVVPTDLPACVALEQASYPEDEAASKTTLQYRQHQAAPYFCCAVMDSAGGTDHEAGEILVGYVCSTRCNSFTGDSMTTHEATGQMLAIHSVVVPHEYRRQGVATYMLKEYIKHISNFNSQCFDDEGKRGSPIEKIVLLAKANLLTFYCKAGFRVVRPSPIVHGSEQWYELDLELDIPWNFPCWVVDAFADPKERGTGNPAAVVLMPDDTDVENKETKVWMQTTAQEFNLAETAFVWSTTPPPSQHKEQTEGEEAEEPNPLSKEATPSWHFIIRYFTPKVEVPLCGHATIATASILFQHKGVPPTDSIVFHAAEDVIGASLAPSTSTHPTQTIRGQRRITMSFPSKPAIELHTEEDRAEVYSMLEDAFSITEDSVLWAGLSPEIGDLLVEITPSSFQSIGYIGLNYNALLKSDLYSRGVILCCTGQTTVDMEGAGVGGGDLNNNSSNTEADFCSRFFAPKAGILEDPVTGSAHCVLAPYFCPMLNKATVIGHQQSERGGYVECTTITTTTMPRTIEGDGELRIEIVGLAITTLSGKVH